VSEGLRSDALEYAFDMRHIATQPAQPRDAARMMVFQRQTGEVHHAFVRNLPQWLKPNDTLVLNRTRVAHARLMLRRESDGRETEGLLAAPLANAEWLLVVKGARKFRQGDRLLLVAEQGASTTRITCLDKVSEGWRVRFEPGVDADAVLQQLGRTPIPPYILRARGDQPLTDAFDREHYQTVYADDARLHSVAAPTAGLHLTHALLDQLAAQGVGKATVTLEVGLGTFKSVETELLSHHPMHHERFEVPEETLALLHRRSTTGRLVVVGTTTARTLESLPLPLPTATYRGESTLLIQPGYQFRYVDALLTNFHLPRSTLLAMVGALIGLDQLKSLYALAQREDYRFYSYGDCMLLL